MDTKLGNTQKENYAVNCISAALDKTGIVDTAHLEKGNTMLSWDGSLFVYKDSNFNKDNFDGQIPTQVKYRTVDRFDKNIKVELADIKNYIKEKRILYFVMQCDANQQERVYYIALHLIDLQQILDTNEGKKDAPLSFAEFPMEDSNAIKRILRKFIQDAKQQEQLLPHIHTINAFELANAGKRLNFSISVSPSATPQDLIKSILDEKPYVYYRSELGVAFPIDHFDCRNLMMVTEEEIKVGAGDKFFFDNIKIIDTKEDRRVQLGKSIIYYVSEGNLKFLFNEKGSVQDRIIALEFMRELSRTKILRFGEHIINFKIADSTISEDVASARLAFYYDLEKLSKQLGLLKEIDLDSMSNEDVQKLKYFCISELYGKTVPLGFDDGQANFITIGNLRLLCFSAKNSDGLYLTCSLFHKGITSTVNFEGKDYEVSPYFGLSDSQLDLDQIDNVNYEDLVTELDRENLSPYELNGYNVILLKLLTQYDRHKNQIVLHAAISLALIIIKFEPSNIAYLNFYQAEMRRGNLSDAEKEHLIEIRNGESTEIEKCACCILLNAQDEFEYHFSKLSTEEQSALKGYPIMNMINGK